MDFGDKYYWRQVFVMLGVWMQGMSCGVVLAYPVVLSSGNSTGIEISPTHSAWLVSSVGLTGVVGFFSLSAILEVYGRRAVHVAICATHLISWIIFYFASNLLWLHIGRFFHGISFGVIYINGVIIGEYSDPVSRGYFITMMKVIMAMGSLICHFLSMWSLREPALVGGAIALLAIVLTLFWPESPSYYALNANYKDCKKTFNWLYGSSIQKQKELAELLSAQMEITKMKEKRNINKVNQFITTCLEKDFLKALFLSILITLTLDASGRYYMVAFIIQIMIELVGSENAVYYSIGVDVITISALTISCFLVRYINRRTVLFFFGFINIVLMLSITLAMFLRYRYVTFSSPWYTLILLLFQSFVVNSSVIPICFALLSEVFPLEYKGIGSTIAGIVFCVFYGVNLKATPIMLRDLGLGGTYAAYGAVLALSLFVMYFMVPETKNRTLQNIANEIKGVVRDSDDVLKELNSEINATPAKYG